MSGRFLIYYISDLPENHYALSNKMCLSHDDPERVQKSDRVFDELLSILPSTYQILRLRKEIRNYVYYLFLESILLNT